MTKRVQLAHRLLPFLAAGVAVLLTLPALWSGWRMDDYYHRAAFLLTEDGRPASIASHFRIPLGDRSLRWLRWQGGRYRAFRPPPVGTIMYLPRASGRVRRAASRQRCVR